MRESSPAALDSLGTSSRGTASEEHSYYAQYESDDSMRLAKRNSKKLNLVGVVPIAGSSSSSKTPSPVLTDQGVAPEEEQEQGVALRDPAPADSEDDEVPTSRKSKTMKKSKRKSSFDHSSSTHKARGNHPVLTFSAASTPSMSTSHSESRHVRSKTTKPDLAVITDEASQEDLQDEAAPAPRRPKAEDLTDLVEDDGKVPSSTSTAEYGRNRRRERLSRLAKLHHQTTAATNITVSSPRQAVAGSEERASPRQHIRSLSPEKQHPEKQPKSILNAHRKYNRSLSPQKTSSDQVASPHSLTTVAAAGHQHLTPHYGSYKSPVTSPRSPRSPTSPGHFSFDSAWNPNESIRRQLEHHSQAQQFPPTKHERNIRSMGDDLESLNPKQHEPPPRGLDTITILEKKPSTNSSSRRSSSKSNHRNSSRDERSSSGHREQEKSRHSSRPAEDDRRNEHDEEYQRLFQDDTQDPETPRSYTDQFFTKQQPISSSSRRHSSGRGGLEGKPRHEKVLPPNVKYWPASRSAHSATPDRAASGSRTYSSETEEEMSDVTSILTSSLDQGNACVNRFLATEYHNERNGSSEKHSTTNAVCNTSEFTQKATSFVAGVWQSCANGIYQTESKKSLLQLEMIAEQSLYQIYHPENLSHNQDLQVLKNQHDFANQSRSEGPRDEGGRLISNNNNRPWGVEEAFQSIGSKVQDMVGGIRNCDSLHMEEDDSLANHKPHRDHQSVVDDMRKMFGSISNLYMGPHQQPYMGDEEDTPERRKVFEYCHGVIGAESDARTSTLTKQCREEVPLNNRQAECTTGVKEEQPLDEEEEEQEEADEGIKTSIYTAAARGIKDRRSMVMELQRRRMKQVKRKEDSLIDMYPQKAEEETAKLRHVYLGLYDQIHDAQVPANEKDKQESQKDTNKTDSPSVGQVEEQESKDEHVILVQNHSADDEDYAVVWAATTEDHESMAPQYHTGSLVDNDESNTVEDEIGMAPKPDEEIDLQQELPEQEPTLKPSKDLTENTDGGKSISASTRYLDAEEYDDASAEQDDKQEQHAETAEKKVALQFNSTTPSPQPDPSFTSSSEEDASLDRKSTMGQKSKTLMDNANSSDDDDEENEVTAVLLASATTNTAHTRTDRMDEMVTAFLDSSAMSSALVPKGMSDSVGENSESNHPMVLLAENSLRDTPPLGDSHKEQDEGEQAAEKEYEDDDDEDEPTLADSTMVSACSGSSHSHDMSMDETINSHRSNRTRNSSSMSSSGSSSYGTCAPSDVPPEIAQPLGPISEYQVLYQISEEDEDAEDTTSEEGEAGSIDGSFHARQDIPFDQDVSFDSYHERRKDEQSLIRRLLKSLVRWTVVCAVANHFGFFGWLIDIDVNVNQLPATTFPTSEIPHAPEYSRLQDSSNVVLHEAPEPATKIISEKLIQIDGEGLEEQGNEERRTWAMELEEVLDRHENEE